MPARWTAVDEKRRLLLVFEGVADGADYLACMQGWLADRPEAVAWGWIHDLRACTGRVSHGDVARFGLRYRGVAGQADRGARSVFVTPDPGFRSWVQACQLEFPHRTFRIVETVAKAEAALGLSPAG